MFSAMDADQRNWRGQRSQNGNQVAAAMIDLTSDSDDDQRSHKMQSLPFPGPQIHPQSFMATHAGPNRTGVNSDGSGGDGVFRQDSQLADYIFDDFDEQMLIRAIEEDLQQDRPPQMTEATSFSSNGQIDRQHLPIMETRLTCIDNVVALFPGICRDYVSQLYDTVSKISEVLAAHILDKSESGTPYPTANEKQKLLKRKRESDEDEEAARKYSALDRVIPVTAGNTCVRNQIRLILGQEFPETPMAFIDTILNQSGYRLFSAYRVLEEAQRTFDPLRPAYNKIRRQRAVLNTFSPEAVELLITAADTDLPKVEILRELQASRRLRAKAELKHQEQRMAELLEEENTRKAQAEGTMSECGCCYGDFPLNRMVHCSDQISHWFCAGCAYRNAETEIGNSRYELKCMSMDGCTAGFSLEQRSRFLDAKTTIALERNELEASLRLAGIENLASCPFCPYAAEYPPIEENREFRCQAPDCEKVTCRLCKLDSHIPKSCEEHAKETGLSIRRQIEEAMSAAMIRNCNKCGCAFVKEEGCNKMTCTRNGCFNVQCYVCSKSCSYNHFDDQSRGGKKGNCPLFDSVDQRHDQEVKRAEQSALEKIRVEHPEYSEEDLKIKMSDNVIKDDERRKATPRARLNAIRLANQAANDLQQYFYNNAQQRVAEDRDIGAEVLALPAIEAEGFFVNDQRRFAQELGVIEAGAVPPPAPHPPPFVRPDGGPLGFDEFQQYMNEMIVLRQRAQELNADVAPAPPLPVAIVNHRPAGQVPAQPLARKPQDKRQFIKFRNAHRSRPQNPEAVNGAAQNHPPAPAKLFIHGSSRVNPPAGAPRRGLRTIADNEAILSNFQREIDTIDLLHQQHKISANALANSVQAAAAPTGAYVDSGLLGPQWIPSHVNIAEVAPQGDFFSYGDAPPFHHGHGNVNRSLPKFRPESEGYMLAPVARGAAPRGAALPYGAGAQVNFANYGNAANIQPAVLPANARQHHPEEWGYALDDWA